MRGLLLISFAAALSACATFGDGSSETSRVPVRRSAGQEYNAGLIDQERGDFDAARRDWDQCLDVAPAASPVRLDCLVALEKLAVSTAPDGKE